MENLITSFSEIHSHPSKQGFNPSSVDLRENGARLVIEDKNFVEGKNQNDNLLTALWNQVPRQSLLLSAFWSSYKEESWFLREAMQSHWTFSSPGIKEKHKVSRNVLISVSLNAFAGHRVIAWPLYKLPQKRRHFGVWDKWHKRLFSLGCLINQGTVWWDNTDIS